VEWLKVKALSSSPSTAKEKKNKIKKTLRSPQAQAREMNRVHRQQ
jgi:hypothetical protein